MSGRMDARWETAGRLRAAGRLVRLYGADGDGTMSAHEVAWIGERIDEAVRVLLADHEIMKPGGV